MGYPKDLTKIEEWKHHISIANTGKKRTDEYKRKSSESRKGIPMKDETKKKISLVTKGKPKSEETKQKIRENHVGMLGCHHTEEHKERQRLKMRGINNVRFGTHLSLTHKQLVSKAQKGRKRLPRTYEYRMKLCECGIGGFWYGNVRYYDKVKYCERFDEPFKERVRAYWDHICFECGTPQNGTKLSIHHIHYDKQMCCNGSPEDVIPLCQSCHSITLRNRDYWEGYFVDLLYMYNPDGKCFFTEFEMKQYIAAKSIEFGFA